MVVKVYLKKNPRRYVREHKCIWMMKLQLDYNETEILQIKELEVEGMKENISFYEYNMKDVDHVVIEN